MDQKMDAFIQITDKMANQDIQRITQASEGLNKLFKRLGIDQQLQAPESISGLKAMLENLQEIQQIDGNFMNDFFSPPEKRKIIKKIT